MYFFLRGPLVTSVQKTSVLLLRGHVTYIVQLNVCKEKSLEQVPIIDLTAVMQKLSINTQITCDFSDFHEYVQFCM